MATPPTRVSYSTPAVGYGDTSTPKTTPTFDVTNGDLLTVIASSENESVTLNTPTASGGSVTWTLRQSIVVTDYCSMYVWTGAVGATATGITVSVARATGSSQWSFGVTVWRNHGGVGSSAKTNVSSGAPSLAISCSENSALAVGCDDWNAVDGTSRTWRTVNGSAITESLYFRNSATYTVYSGYRTDTGSAGSQTVGLSAPSGQKYSIVAVEVLGTSSGPDPKSGTDSAAASEAVALAAASSLTDTATATEGTTALARASTLVDSATISDSAALARSSGVTDTASLADSAALSLAAAGTDTATLTDTAAVQVAASAADSGTLTDTSDVDDGTATVYRFPSGAGLTPSGAFSDPTPPALNLGTVLSLTAAGDIAGVALYATAATTFTAQLWADGVKVAEKTGISHAGSGWVDGLFDTPYPGTTGVDYIVSALQDTGTAQYSARTLTFSDGTNPVLIEVGPARSNTTSNGLYTYGTGIPATASGTNGMWFGVDAIIAASAPTGPAPVNDGGTLTDASGLTVALAVADSAAMTETSAAARSASDSAALTDTATLTAAPSAVDSGALTDSANLNTGSNQSTADSAGLADSQTLAAALARTDTAALTDTAVVSVPKSATDSAALAEQTDTLITDADPDATLAESVTLTSAMSRADTGTLTDTASVSTTGNPSSTDTGTVSDTAAITAAAAGSDSAGLADTATLSAAGNPSVVDAGTLAEASSIIVVITAADTASVGDASGLTVSLTRADSGSFTDTSSVLVGGVTVTGTDTGTLVEAVTLTVAAVAADAGALAELALVGATMTRADTGTVADAAVRADILPYPLVRGQEAKIRPSNARARIRQ